MFGISKTELAKTSLLTKLDLCGALNKIAFSFLDVQHKTVKY